MSTLHDAVVRREVLVPVSGSRAFEFFAHRMIEWWPREYTFSGCEVECISLDPHSGGLWYESDTSGLKTIWGTVHEYALDSRLVLSWRISPQRTPEPDESRASTVAVIFTTHEGSGTRLDLEHSRFERHAEGGEIMYAGMDSAEGWTKILNRFAERVIDGNEHMF